MSPLLRLRLSWLAPSLLSPPPCFPLSDLSRGEGAPNGWCRSLGSWPEGQSMGKWRIRTPSLTWPLAQGRVALLPSSWRREEGDCRSLLGVVGGLRVAVTSGGGGGLSRGIKWDGEKREKANLLIYPIWIKIIIIKICYGPNQSGIDGSGSPLYRNFLVLPQLHFVRWMAHKKTSTLKFLYK
jgi:hypothetical protein